eukprot:TRINITY_DN5625_c0_g1_i1.p1 TRINITY_DN5625_c0_g1~~TRINITY_DN5625_c0_g1_i1.p1  ORF type:complete len:474 (+),score=129.97 TRINITY_DN5625_c0_g1_i1:58-1479(+)
MEDMNLDTLSYPFDFDQLGLLTNDNILEKNISSLGEYGMEVVPTSPSLSEDSSSSGTPDSPSFVFSDWGVDRGFGYYDQVRPLSDSQVKMMQGGYYGVPVDRSVACMYPVGTEHMYTPAAGAVKSEMTASKKRKAQDIPEKKMPAKKRRKIDIDMNPETNGMRVSFDRKELLQISSEDFDDYIERLANFKSITKNDKKEIIRQRRLIKNRESAKESRRRKKSHVAELEQKVNELTERNGNLQAALNSVSQENMHLRLELDKFRKMVSGEEQVPDSQYLTKGVVLFVVLLSFGLFFGISGEKKFDDESFKPYSERIFTGKDNFKATSFDVNSEQNFVNPRIQEVYSKAIGPKEPAVLSPKVNVDETLESKSNYSLEENMIPKIEEEIKSEPEIKQEDVEMGDVDEVPELKFESNTTYLLCKNMKYLTPEEDIPYDPELPLRLSLLLEEGESDKLLQVTCQVTDMHHTRYKFTSS